LLHETRNIDEMSYETKTNGHFKENHEPLKRDLSNKDEILAFVEGSADQVECQHLFHVEFSQECTTAPSGDKMAVLAARRQAQAAAAATVKAEAVAEEDNKGLGFKPKGVQKQGNAGEAWGDGSDILRRPHKKRDWNVRRTRDFSGTSFAHLLVDDDGGPACKLAGADSTYRAL
jgi:hypothetical protein